MDTLHYRRPSATDTTTTTTTTTKKQHKRKQKGGDESLKVVYISSPMKVRTSASRFRSLVQHLTGKHSDITPYVDAVGVADYHDEDGILLPDRLMSSVSSDDTTSDSLLGTADNVSASQIMDDRFDGYFSSLCDPSHSHMYTHNRISSQMDDALGSYDDLMM